MIENLTIGGRVIGPGEPPYVIAELSGNHNGDINKALRIIDAAQQAGADAVKIQTYRPDTMTLESDAPDFQITDGLWAGHKLFDLYKWAHTPWEWHEALFTHAAKRGITLFSTPFDPTAVDLLESLDTPAYKIASFEAVDLQLIFNVASKGKPMLISTGMADLEEITDAVEAAHSGGCNELALLHCVSGYPAPATDYNLATIADMIARFGVPVGLSDHTLDNTTALASVALGAVVIEKHLTLDRAGGGPDDSFSLEPSEFAALCRDVRSAWQAIGAIDYGRKSSEIGSVKFRRSLYFVKDMEAGEVITEDCVRSVRPGYGLAPKYINEILNQRLVKNVDANTAVRWEAFGK